MLPPALCVCPALARVDLGREPAQTPLSLDASAPPPLLPQLPPLRVAVYMHQKEFGRASNTGCLLGTLGARVYVAGIASDEASLLEALGSGADAGACAVLWPGEGAVSLAELRASTPPERWARGLTLVAVDATWACARRMLRRLPASAPRLSVDAAAFEAGRSLLHPARRYAGEAAERKCTYEAVVAALHALGALRAGEREDLQLTLKLKVDAVLLHKNRQPAYDSEALAAARLQALRDIADE